MHIKSSDALWRLAYSLHKVNELKVGLVMSVVANFTKTGINVDEMHIGFSFHLSGIFPSFEEYCFLFFSVVLFIFFFAVDIHVYGYCIHLILYRNRISFVYLFLH